MRTLLILLALVLCLSAFTAPIHEAGHVIAANLLGGRGVYVHATRADIYGLRGFRLALTALSGLAFEMLVWWALYRLSSPQRPFRAFWGGMIFGTYLSGWMQTTDAAYVGGIVPYMLFQTILLTLIMVNCYKALVRERKARYNGLNSRRVRTA